MAKRKTTTVNVTETQPTITTPPKTNTKTVPISVPVEPVEADGYEAQQIARGQLRLHVNAQLGKDAANTFMQIREGLRKSNAKLQDGKPVWSNVETLKWMMEQVKAGVA